MTDDSQSPTTAYPVDPEALARARAAEEAWQPGPPEGDVWTPRPWVHPSVRREEGRRERKRVPRAGHAAFTRAPAVIPSRILAAQEEQRLQFLVPLRHQRMAADPFAYYRGTPAVMAADLADTPRTDIVVQASGDAHCANFGMFASPNASWCSMPTTSTRRCPGPGNGTSSASPRAS